jgi:catalase
MGRVVIILIPHGGCPYQAKISEGGFSSFNERVDAHKVRERSESFADHFGQAKLF